MSDKIEGVPDGWRLVRIGKANRGEWTINNIGEPSHVDYDTALSRNHNIVEKIEQPKKYRPFANAKEFEPHRDRWWRFKDESDGLFRTYYYSDKSHMWHDWHQSFDKKVFDDGSPFGVEVKE